MTSREIALMKKKMQNKKKSNENAEVKCIIRKELSGIKINLIWTKEYKGH